MVLVSECFPSNHNSVNEVREAYRASIMVASFPSGQAFKCNNDASAAKNTPLKGSFAGIERSKLKDEIQDYPGGVKAFLVNSKMHLSSPDAIEDNIKKVQQLVAKMTRTSMESIAAPVIENELQLSPKLAPPTPKIAQPTLNKSQGTLGNNDEYTETIYHRQGKTKHIKEASCVEPHPLQTKKSTITPKRQKALTARLYSSSTTRLDYQSNGAKESIQSKNITSNVPKTARTKKPKNNSTPRYLDVFNKKLSSATSSVQSQESRNITISTTTVRNSRYVATFEQNWAPLTVPVVNIEL